MDKEPAPPRPQMMHINVTVQDQLKILQFIDFVCQILQIDPKQRLTPLQALSHPFITGQEIWPPFMPMPDHQLRLFREANLGRLVSDDQMPQKGKFNMQQYFAQEVN